MNTPLADVGTLRVALGLLSAAAYQDRRDAVRSTWASVSPGAAGSMQVRFVVARPQALRGASLDTEADASLHAERRRYDDLVLYAPRVTPSRLLSPLVGLLEWLRYASTHLRHVHFIAKCDDDVYIWPPELFSILSRVRTQPHVYLGRFFFTTWNVEHHGHNGSSYAADTTAHEARQ